MTIHTADFDTYPPVARKVATEHLVLLQRLPSAFAAVLLRELIQYDWKFPAERADIDAQLHYLESMRAEELQAVMHGFAELPLSAELAAARPALAPSEFVEKLTAQIWLAHAMDQFRAAAADYQRRFLLTQPQLAPVVPRCVVVVVGKDVPVTTTRAVFQKLRPYGTYFTQVDPSEGLGTLIRFVRQRADAHAEPYGHWYVDGGILPVGAASSTLTSISYDALGGIRAVLLRKMSTAKSSGVVGPESMRTLLANLRPDEMGKQMSTDPILGHFELSLLTEGAGTQIFSTTFVQWAAREILRRAQPLTLMIRFAPRQIERPMNELLLASTTPVKDDPEGSLIDADMGAYYTWINLMRLSHAESSSFIAWFEDRHEALVASPAMAKQTMSSAKCTLPQILGWIS